MEVGQINSLEINHLGEISYVDPDTERETYADVQARLDVVDGKSYATLRQQKRWKQQGNCMNCGDYYYWAKECPYGNPTTKKRRPMTRRQLYNLTPWAYYDGGSESDGGSSEGS
ncbi:hypothetical protein ACEPPN_010986 [Leptodophora sp. 'Broadleaf-Isolate-01']